MTKSDNGLRVIKDLLKTNRALGQHEIATRNRIIKAHKEWPEKGYWFDLAAGERVIDFVENFCKHFKGEWAGSSMKLEPWQKVIILEAFSWKRPDGYRLHRTLWLELARKNGKSQLAAALGVYLLIADGEPGAEIYSSATKRDQARIVFDCATHIINQSKELQQYVNIQRSNLSVLRTTSKFEPLSSESSTLDGLSPHCNIVDELHSHRDRKVWDTLVTAQGSRRQPMNILITTAGIYDQEQIGWQLHDHAIGILSNTIEDDSWFVWISAADEGDDPYNEQTWEKANPNMNVSIYPSFIKQRAGEALSEPSSMNAFQRLHLNQWTQQVQRWLSMDDWDKCDGSVDLDALIGRECFAGLDLSSTQDLTALALLFPPLEDELYRLWVRCYIPRDSMVKRETKERIPYSLWEKSGWITPTEGNVIDYDYILQDIATLADKFDIQEVAYDPWSATQTAIKIRDDIGLNAVPVRQGFISLSEPSKEFERLVVSGKLAHGSNSCLAWQANNVSVKLDPSGNIKPDKGMAKRHKIDGIIASILAVGRASLKPEGSVYEDEGIMVL